MSGPGDKFFRWYNAGKSMLALRKLGMTDMQIALLVSDISNACRDDERHKMANKILSDAEYDYPYNSDDFMEWLKRTIDEAQWDEDHDV